MNEKTTAGLVKRLLARLNKTELPEELDRATPNGGEPCRIVSYGLRPTWLDETDRRRRPNRSGQQRARDRAASKAARRARRKNRQ